MFTKRAPTEVKDSLREKGWSQASGIVNKCPPAGVVFLAGNVLYWWFDSMLINMDLKFGCFMYGKFILLSAGFSHVFSAHLESNTTLVM